MSLPWSQYEPVSRQFDFQWFSPRFVARRRHERRGLLVVTSLSIPFQAQLISFVQVLQWAHAATHGRNETGIGILQTLLSKATGFKHGVNLQRRGLLAAGL